MKADAEHADVRPGLPMRWEDITPAENLPIAMPC
jgi:hypothetical protein